VFLRAENGDLCVGIRRAKRGIGGGTEYLSGWNQEATNCASSYSGFMRDGKNNYKSMEFGGRVKGESVIEAANLAANGQPFEVVYYPRASTPEFFVKASAVRAAMQIHWSSGMRFKMPFETEDSSRISWFMGTISSVQVTDPVRWPDSPWRLLQVAWDEPDLLQNVKCVNPWLVEVVSNIPVMHLPPFSPPRKKMRLPQHADYSLISQFPMPTFPSNLLNPSSPYCGFSDNIPAGIQGARHAQFGISSEHLPNHKLQSSLFPIGFQHLDHAAATPSRVPGGDFIDCAENNDVSCLLTKGNTAPSLKENNEVKTPHIVLFGQLIFTEEQMSKSCSGDTIGNSSSDGSPEKMANFSDGSAGLHPNGSLENSSDGGSPWYRASETGHCKVFIESIDLGFTLDLSIFGSYEELLGKLANMFGLESSLLPSNMLYHDAVGAVKHPAHETFSEFVKTARRLTILTDSGSDNIES
jgi:hypothetical protein